MEDKSKNSGLLNKITVFLFGFIVNVLTIAIFLKALSSIWGMVIGIAISIGGSIYIIKKTNNKNWHIAAKGIITSAIIIVVLSLVFWVALQSMFAEIAN